MSGISLASKFFKIVSPCQSTRFEINWCMAIFIDSAKLRDIEEALQLGWVSGVTTNPVLMAKAGISARTLLKDIALLTTGPVFYQLVSETFEEMITEADHAQELLEERLVVKLPPTDLGFKVCTQLSSRIPCCPTAIYSPAQAIVAVEAGAQYLALYVNRATKGLGDGIQLTREIAQVLRESQTELLAASLKSQEEAIQAFNAGAHHLTMGLSTLQELSKHPLSSQAVAQFKQDGSGL
jgi:transaldolase